MEATRASEATKMAVRGNMHMNIRVFEVPDFNFVVKNDLRGHMTSDLTSVTLLDYPGINAHIASNNHFGGL